MTGQQLRNSILQEAIHGRLVPNTLQPGEKSARELLSDILASRQKAENEAKGKKAKKLTLSEIEEEPWDLPEGWCWCKLGDIANVIGGFAFKSTEYKKEGYRVIRISDFNELGFVDKSIVRYEYNEKLSPYLLQPKDILMCMTGGTVGKTYYATTINEPMLVNQRVATIRAVVLNADYVNCFIKSPYIAQIIDDSKNSTNDNISMGDILGFHFPLPPLSIQHAIVEKIESLLPLVDEYDAAQGELKTLNEALPDKLRKSVLQEAIHGRLVPNTLQPGEKTARELLADILAERQKAENAAKGKKAKKLTLSEIEEEPWELPEGWCWCRIQDLFEHSAGKAQNSSQKTEGKVYPYLTTSNVYWEGIDFTKVKEMAFTEEEYTKCSAIKGDLLVCEGGDVGRSCIWPYDYKIGLQNHIHRLRPVSDINVKFFYYVIMLYKSIGLIAGKGIGITGLSAGVLKGTIIPLPPLSIQHAIVEKIEEIFKLLEK